MLCCSFDNWRLVNLLPGVYRTTQSSSTTRDFRSWKQLGSLEILGAFDPGTSHTCDDRESPSERSKHGVAAELRRGSLIRPSRAAAPAELKIRCAMFARLRIRER